MQFIFSFSLFIQLLHMFSSSEGSFAIFLSPSFIRVRDECRITRCWCEEGVEPQLGQQVSLPRKGWHSIDHSIIKSLSLYRTWRKWVGMMKERWRKGLSEQRWKLYFQQINHIYYSEFILRARKLRFEELWSIIVFILLHFSIYSCVSYCTWVSYFIAARCVLEVKVGATCM